MRKAFTLWREIRRWRPDIIHVTHVDAQYVAARLFLLYAAKYFFTIHGSELYWTFGRKPILKRIRAWLVRRAYLRAQGLICVSNYTHELLLHTVRGVHRSHVVINGINLKRLSSPNAEELGRVPKSHLITIARLIPEKGIDAMIRLVPELTKTIPDLLYVIIGNGPYRETLEALIKGLHVEKNVLLLGETSPEILSAALSHSEVFVLLSRPGDRVEGFGLVIIEAASLGVPAIGSRLEGIRDAIVDGQTGLLVDPYESEEVVAGIRKLLEDRELRKKMGEAARKRAISYCNNIRMADETLAVYRTASPAE